LVPLKQLENKISSYDQKIYSLNTNQIRDSKIAIYEIEKLKKALPNTDIIC
jgi:hypothetical protein